MNFETVNKNHREIKAIKRKDKAISLMTIEKKSFYFTAEATKVFYMHGGDRYLHFVRGKDAYGKETGLWYLVVNNVNTGFKISIMPLGGGRIASMPMVRLLMQSTKQKIGSQFIMQATNHTHHGCQVIELLPYKTNSQNL